MHVCIYTCRHRHTLLHVHTMHAVNVHVQLQAWAHVLPFLPNSVVTLKMAFWQLNMMQLYTPEVKAVEEGTSFTYFVISHISGHVLLERWMWDGGRCMFMVDLKGMLHEFGYHI